MPIVYIHRTNREGYKAGALENGLKTAKGEFVAIFDADFLPEPDFLRRTIPYFMNPDGGEKVGMVQTRWTYLNSDYSLLTNVETILLDGHFVVEHGARSRRGTFFNFNGTAGVWRRKAIDEAGGWEHDTLTEDTDLSYRSQLMGWKFLYLPNIECASELPVDMNGFKAQQARWAKGLMQTAKKILPRVLKSDAPWHVKAEAFFHLTANISYPLMVLLSTMLLPVMIVRFQQGWFQMLLIDLPLFLASTCSISSFYLVAQRELRPKTWQRTFFYLPFVMATGIGISVFFHDRRLRDHQRKLRHRAVPAALRLGLSLHGLHVARPNLLRAPAFWCQRSGNASRHFRRTGLLILYYREACCHRSR
jgi:cellulose synthase/poly-beta-1,6-N-acetylglucosamine synthase-like glycosyltransferase